MIMQENPITQTLNALGLFLSPFVLIVALGLLVLFLFHPRYKNVSNTSPFYFYIMMVFLAACIMVSLPMALQYIEGARP